MSHLLKYTEWETATGWHCNDVSDLGAGSGYWWHVPRMLGMELTDYVLLLKDKFNAKNFHYNPKYNVLLWNWESYNDCHAFVLFVNKEARKRKYFICGAGTN